MTRPKAVALITIGCLLLLVCLLPVIIGEGHTGKVAQAKGCMGMLQKCAEIYAAAHDGLYPSSFKDMIPIIPHNKASQHNGLPPNFLGGGDDYVIDLPENVTNEIHNGNFQGLEVMKRTGCIGYGVTSDRRNFVIVAFDDKDHGSMPIRGYQGTPLVLSDHGKILGKR
jgi:hypothetical protein